MFAGQIKELGKIELVDVPEAELCDAGQIIFEPSTTCLCGSDLPFFTGHQVEYPLKPGLSLHEMVGRVTATSGTRFEVGDYVLAVPEAQVGFFERYALSEDRAIPVDPRIASEEIAVLAQPLGTAIFALKKIPHLIDIDVAVVGQGPMGQIINASLSNMGARSIIGIDIVTERLERSTSLGATHTVASRERDPIEAVREITDGRMADLVVECVGHEDQALDLCVRLCRQAGTILCFGVPPDSITIGPWRELFDKNIAIHTTVNPDFERDFPLAMQWIAEQRIDVEKLITHRYAVSDIQDAYETFRDRREGALKVIVGFGD